MLEAKTVTYFKNKFGIDPVRIVLDDLQPITQIFSEPQSPIASHCRSSLTSRGSSSNESAVKRSWKKRAPRRFRGSVGT